MMHWNEKALKLYYQEGLNITKIAEICNVSKQAVSKFLINNARDKYQEEKERRKKLTIERERLRKRKWKRENKNTGYVDPEIIKRQHIIDVLVLSADRYNSY